MVETFYLHLEFQNKKGGWSINLPFLCDKCGVCCTLDDFLTAGEITSKRHMRPEVEANAKALYEALGKMWEEDEAKYDQYIQQNPCPFLVDKSCSIYEVRPEGCRLFPNTAFGMLTENCDALNRFKKMRAALKKGRVVKETTYQVNAKSEPIKPAKFTEKQIRSSITKLRQAGLTDEEFVLFNIFNGQN
jgi:Fe-S-cluster containining protein